MRKLIILLPVLTSLAFSNAQSQTTDSTSVGSKALLFDFAGLGNLGANAYNGGIGGKYFFSDQTALRAMLLFALDNRTFAGAKNDEIQFGLGAGLECHLPVSTHVSPYVGCLLTATSEDTRMTGATSTATSVGAAAVAGVEYFFNKNISLSAEYQFGLTATNTTQSPGSTQQELEIGFQTANLTLGVYF
ncbi:MAG: outer membrane beta-barrel protein [Candidatus Kryptoniota bacterium]